MIKKRLFAAMFLAGISAPSFGMGFPIDKDRSLPLKVGTSGPTRFVIEGEKITDVFVYPKELTSVTLHASGQVFVVPPAGGSPISGDTGASSKKLFLTLMGEKGSVQDLTIDFVQDKSEVVRLIDSELLDSELVKKGEENAKKD